MQLPFSRHACLLLICLASACARAPEAAPVKAQAPARGSSEVHRIVPASATAADFVAALVDPARIAGMPAQALEYSSLHDDPRFTEHARFRSFLAEPILMLRPDLVISDPWQSRDTQQRLSEAGVRVLTLPEIATYADARAVLLDLGAKLGVEQRAQDVVLAFDARVAALELRAAARGERLRAMSYSNFGAAGSTAGAGTTVDEIMRLVGLENLVASAGREGHASVTFEELLAFDPDLILVSLPLKQAAAQAGDRGGASQELLRGEAILKDLRAVREDRILSLPAWLFATGSHELVGSAEVLADELDALLSRLERAGSAR